MTRSADDGDVADPSESTAGMAAMTLGPSLGNGQPQPVMTTTAMGTNVNMRDLLGSSTLGEAKPASQTWMETRIDFHTHPRSLALAHLQLADWRTHDKLKTVGALLVVCLNLETPPPDSVRPAKSAVLEAWVDPKAPVQAPTQEELALQAANNGAMAPRNAGREQSPMKAISENLQRQFEHIQQHVRYKTLPDCVMEDLRKNCMQHRKTGKAERLMFYYNGHGVPRPTTNGDIWVFNRQYTQYIPVSAPDLMSWIGTPTVFVWDCSHAMNIVKAFERNSKLREAEITRIRLQAESIGAKLPISRSDVDTLALVTSRLMTLFASQAQAQAAAQAATSATTSATLGATGHQGLQAASHSSQGGPSQQQQQQQQQQQNLAGGGPGVGAINPALVNLALLPPIHHEDIHFAATRHDEQLPTNPELPADLFTSCLTTPIKVALRFWVTRNPGTSKVTLDMCDKLPGSVKDRQTPIGELNWIFTSITDTIAWSTLPREQFRKLFRQDVVVASLYRNYMLADRVMRFYGVHPQCRPEIPATHKHPLWDSLDLEIDMCLQQLPRLLKEEERRKSREERAKRSERDRVARMSKREALQPQQQRYPMAAAGGATGAGNSATYSEFLSAQSTRLDIVGTFASVTGRQGSRVGLGGAAESEDEGSSSGSDSDGAGEGGNSLAGGGGGGGEWKATGYISSSYFSNQLYAFEVWLQHAATEVSQFVADQGPDHTPRSLSTARPGTVEVPDELPAVLQVLLSNHYRLRALILLYRFMNLGPWAVDLAMAVGIHPYMSKLLGSTTMEIREILILVWARLSAVDMALQPELLKSDGFEYFVTYLANNIHMQTEAVSEKVRLSDTVSAASAFTLAMLCRDTAAAQQACFDERVLDYFLVYLQRPDNGTEERACLRTWVLLCLAELWKGHANAKWMAVTYKLCVIASKREDQAANQANGQRGGAPSFEELLASNADDDGGEDARNAQDLVIQMAFHRSAVVRAAAVYAMGTLVSDLAQLGDDPGVVTIVRLAERQIHAVLAQLAASDGSAMVRREVAQAIGGAVLASDMAGAGAAMARVVAEDVGDARRPAAAADMQGLLVRALLRLTTDPHPDVALVAREAVDVVMQVHCGSSAEAGADLARQMLLHPQRLPLAESAPQRQTVVLPSQRQSMALPSQRQSMISPSQLPQRQSVVSPSQRQPAIQQSHRHSMIQQSPRQPAAQQPPASAQPPQQHSAAPAPAALADAWRAWGRRELRDGVCASTLVDWAGAHFTEFDISLFANVSGRLQGSAALVESRERTRRLARMEAGARAMGSGAAHMKWTDVTPVGSTGSAGAASAALLHPLEPHAVVASRGSVAVFDWEVQAQVGAFDTGAAQIAALHLINPLGQARLLVGGADGSVRIFASHAPDFAPPLAAAGFPRPRLLAAFAAVPWAAPTSCGLATAWNQRAGVLLAAAAADRAVRVWDVASELCIEEVAVAALGGVTCLSHDGGMGNLFAAGSAAGVVRVVDRRLDARRAVVANWREHEPAAVRSVHMRAGLLEVVSASAAGDVKYWDLRHRPSVFTLHDAHAGLDRMIVHESAPVLLTASAASVKVWNQRGVNIGAVTAAKHAHASHASSYMRSLASTPAPPPAPAVAVAALHAFLPIALMVTDDGRVSYIQPKKPVGSAAAATPSSFAPAASASAPRTPSLASSRANSML